MYDGCGIKGILEATSQATPRWPSKRSALRGGRLVGPRGGNREQLPAQGNLTVTRPRVGISGMVRLGRNFRLDGVGLDPYLQVSVLHKTARS